MKKRLLLLSALLLMTLVLAACSPSQPASQPPAPPANEPAAQPAQAAQDENEAAAALVAAQDAEFLDTVLPVHDDLPAHLGAEVTVSGMVLIRETYGGNEFMVARLVVECCPDDAAATGFVTQWDGEMPEADQWVTVTGVIDQREAEDPVTGMTFLQPYLIATNVDLIEPFESELLFLSPFE